MDIVDIYVSIRMALTSTRELVDEATLTECENIQEQLCTDRRDHMEFVNDAQPWHFWICYHMVMKSRFVSLETRMLELGILKERSLTNEILDLDEEDDEREGSKDTIDNDVLVFVSKAFAAIQSHIVSQLQLESAFRCTSKQASLALQEIDTPTRLLPATSLEIPLITIVARNNNLEQYEDKIKTPRRLMSRHAWHIWREQIQNDVNHRYPEMHVKVCIQPFGDRLFHHSMPQQCSIVIWHFLAILVFVTQSNDINVRSIIKIGNEDFRLFDP